MQYWRIARAAWLVTSRTRALWWLGAISAAQGVVYAAVYSALAVPMAVIPQFFSAIAKAETGAIDVAGVDAVPVLLGTAQWLGAHAAEIGAAVSVVFSVWLILSVFDVAAQTGMVTQVMAVIRRRPASGRDGLRDGFRLWWRVVALLALAALPSLVYLLAMALVMFFTISLPFYLGKPPDIGAALVSNMALAPLSAIVSIVSIPLAVLLQLAVRFAVVDDLEPRPAFGSAWRLVRANLAEVTLTWAMVAVVTLIAGVAFAAVAAVAVALLGVLLLGVGIVASSGDAGAGWRVALVGGVGFAGLLFAGFQAVMFIWQSAVWTLVWQDRTGRNMESVVDSSSRGIVAPTTEGNL